MKNIYSFLSCCIICIVLLGFRILPPDYKSKIPLRITTWDALGYYMYLPGIFIYHDVTKLDWFFDIDSEYHLSGGTYYQIRKHKNGNYVFKYLGGVSILQSPFFFSGHWVAKHTKFEADGFSPPYQYAIALSVLFYCILSIFLLRKILLNYFNDITSALTLLFLTLATNFVHYVAADCGLSHGFIFPLYVLVLYFTFKWHKSPGILWASLIGLVIGLATISRPTEAIMLFIPLFWSTQTKEQSKIKWALVKKYKNHIFYTILFGFIGILPQLIYWKIASGSFIYDVGSKWDFLTPHLRVLFGWEKGWFIYTPITVFFIIGLFFTGKYPFKKSVIIFCLLNIYIIISWHKWRYGGSYSCRALMQSYPVFALPFAAFIHHIKLKKWRFLFYALGFYLVFVNLFQTRQVSKKILHYDHMNRKYYGRIYLNPNPSPLDMSLLDTDEVLKKDILYKKEIIAVIDSSIVIKKSPDSSAFLINTNVKQVVFNDIQLDSWIKVESKIQVSKGIWESYLNSYLQIGDSLKHNKIRLHSPISKYGEINDYTYYVKIPENFKEGFFKLFVSSSGIFEGVVEYLKITYLSKRI